MNLTGPTFITATCTGCEAPRTFELHGSSPDEARAEYRCEDCGHSILLDLDP